MTTKQPLPRFRVRTGRSRFYPYTVWDGLYKETVLRGFDRRIDAQNDADRLNTDSTTHDAVWHPTKETQIT